MKLYRIKQFYWSLLSKIDKDDRKFVKYILNESELKLFYKLSISEQKHSIRVAYDVNKMCSMKNHRFNSSFKGSSFTRYR